MNSDSSSIRVVVVGLYLVAMTIGCLVFAISYYFQYFQLIDVADFYQKNMRASLFAGFLTMGSFLLSLKTGIVIKIKENVYDQVQYQQKVDEARSEGIATTVYAPLKRLSKALSAAVLFALIASVLQLTLGLLPLWWAAASCLAIASMALFLLFVAFTLIQQNLHSWFEFLDDKAEKEQVEREARKKENE